MLAQSSAKNNKQAIVAQFSRKGGPGTSTECKNNKTSVFMRMIQKLTTTDEELFKVLKSTLLFFLSSLNRTGERTQL